MAERHGAAIHIDLVAVDLQIADEFFRDDGKRLVDFDQVDIVQRQPRFLQHLARGGNRRIQHQGRAVTHIGHGDETRARLQAVLLRISGRGEQNSRGTIDHTRRIAGMMDVFDLEVRIDLTDQAAIGGALFIQRHFRHRGKGRLQRGKCFQRRLRAGEFFMIERQRAVFVIDRHQAFLEMIALDRGIGPLLADDREFFRRAAGNALKRCDRIGADALMRLGMQRAQMQIAAIHHRRRLRIGGRCGVAHHLRTAGDDQIFHAGHDLGGGKIHRCDARTAETVERDAAGAGVIAGIEGRHAAEIAALFAALGRGAPDNVVHLRRVQIIAFGKRLQNGGGKTLRMNVGQRTLADLADAAWRAAGIDDVGFRHGEPRISLTNCYRERFKAPPRRASMAGAGHLFPT